MLVMETERASYVVDVLTGIARNSIQLHVERETVVTITGFGW